MSDKMVRLLGSEAAAKLRELPKDELIDCLAKIAAYSNFTIKETCTKPPTWSDTVKSVKLDNRWADKLLDLPEKEDLVKVLAEIANHGGIQTASIEKARTNIPSFTGVKWETVAEKFGIKGIFEFIEFDRIDDVVGIPPIYRLPPSVHKNMYEAAWNAQDMFGEPGATMSDEARFRLLDPYLTRIVGLFHGRVINSFERLKDGTEYAAGGFGYKIISSDRVLFIVIESKLENYSEDDAAQLFDALANANKRANYPTPIIHGLLTDLHKFSFYSYHFSTKRFAYDSSLMVDRIRDSAFSDMVPVADKIFSTIFTAYHEDLEANCRNADETRQWVKIPQEAALRFSRKCRDELEKPVETVEEVVTNSTAALGLLGQSTRSIRRVAVLPHPFTGRYDPSSVEEHARIQVHQKCFEMVERKNGEDGMF